MAFHKNDNIIIPSFQFSIMPFFTIACAFIIEAITSCSILFLIIILTF
jgi:hypothetical protein